MLLYLFFIFCQFFSEAFSGLWSLHFLTSRLELMWQECTVQETKTIIPPSYVFFFFFHLEISTYFVSFAIHHKHKSLTSVPKRFEITETSCGGSPAGIHTLHTHTHTHPHLSAQLPGVSVGRVHCRKDLAVSHMAVLLPAALPQPTRVGRFWYLSTTEKAWVLNGTINNRALQWSSFSTENN